MKRIKLILAIVFIFVAVSNTEAQRVKQMSVYKNSSVLYSAILSVSDSIKFTTFTCPTIRNEITETAVGSYVFGGQILTVSGTYQRDIRLPNGCDSTVVLHLTVSGDVEINGLRWSLYNVDEPGTFVEHPTDYGKCYQWNRRTGWRIGPSVQHSNWDGTDAPGNSWTSENDPCPAGWRVPTKAEYEALILTAGLEGDLDDVHGRFFADNRLFFPFAGGIMTSSYNGNGVYVMASDNAFYWTSTAGTGNIEAWCFRTARANTTPFTYKSERNYGYSVRCVHD